jgi:hypothetical protein
MLEPDLSGCQTAALHHLGLLAPQMMIERNHTFAATFSNQNAW